MTDCEGSAWDVISAAGALSQLAGVIAGFVFAGVIVLLSQPRPHTSTGAQQSGSARLRALIPFFATFVAMGLNAYVFALLTGESGDQSCRRVWTATAVASGMLAIGTVAAVSGIILLVRAYLAREDLTTSDTRQLSNLERMLTVTIWSLALVSPGLLLQRVYEFLRVWYDGNLHGLGWLWFIAIGAACTVVVLGAVTPSLTSRLIHGREGNPAVTYDRLLFFAGVCTVVYSVAGTAVVGFFLGVAPASWASTPAAVPWIVAVTVAVLPSVAIGGWLYSVHGIVRIR